MWLSASRDCRVPLSVSVSWFLMLPLDKPQEVNLHAQEGVLLAFLRIWIESLSHYYHIILMIVFIISKAKQNLKFLGLSLLSHRKDKVKHSLISLITWFVKTMYFVDSLQRESRDGRGGRREGGERVRKKDTALTCTSKYIITCYSFQLKGKNHSKQCGRGDRCKMESLGCILRVRGFLALQSA